MLFRSRHGVGGHLTCERIGLRRGAGVLPQDRGPNRFTAGIEQQVRRSLAGTTERGDARRIDAGGSEQLTDDPYRRVDVVVRVLLGPPGAGPGHRVRNARYGEDVTGRVDDRPLCGGRADVKANVQGGTRRGDGCGTHRRIVPASGRN